MKCNVAVIFVSVVIFLLLGISGYFIWVDHSHLHTLELQLKAVAAAQGPESFSTPLPAIPTVPSTQAADLTALTQRVTALEQKASQKPPMTEKVVKVASNVKEVTIFLGSGGTNNRDWTDIPSALSTVNLNNYTHVKAIYFEAALSIIGGEAHARLVNASTGAIYFNSEVWNNTSSSVWETSQPLFLPTGTSQYSVQLKSTSGEHASLDGSRLHIYLE